MDMWAKLAANPMALAQAQMNMYLDYMRLWQSSWLKLLGQPSDPVAAPGKGDARFKDDEWQSNFVFDYVKQSYLIAARHIPRRGVERRGHSRRVEEEGRLLHPPVHRRAQPRPTSPSPTRRCCARP